LNFWSWDFQRACNKKKTFYFELIFLTNGKRFEFETFVCVLHEVEIEILQLQLSLFVFFFTEKYWHKTGLFYVLGAQNAQEL